MSCKDGSCRASPYVCFSWDAGRRLQVASEVCTFQFATVIRERQVDGHRFVGGGSLFSWAEFLPHANSSLEAWSRGAAPRWVVWSTAVANCLLTALADRAEHCLYRHSLFACWRTTPLAKEHGLALLRLIEQVMSRFEDLGVMSSESSIVPSCVRLLAFGGRRRSDKFIHGDFS